MKTQLAQSMFRVFQETRALLPMLDAHLTEHARKQYWKHKEKAKRTNICNITHQIPAVLRSESPQT